MSPLPAPLPQPLPLPPGELVALGCALCLACAGIRERRRLERARARVPIRIHVNGTRGKSDVTRLIAAGLRRAGVRTLGKSTGTAARWLLPDGTEEPVRRRWGRARIQEQVLAVERAAALGCEALVVECMALRPEYQHATEHLMLKSTIGVITNARPDHGDVMGWERADVARSLSNTVPVGGILICGDAFVYDEMRDVARRRGTEIRLAELPPQLMSPTPRVTSPLLQLHPRENVAVALTVLACLGIAPGALLAAAGTFAPDPGAARWTACSRSAAATEPVVLLDALAANDPDSLELVVRRVLGRWLPAGVVAIFHHRADRAERFAPFARLFARWAAQGVVCAGGGTSPLVRLWITGEPVPRYALRHLRGLPVGFGRDPGFVLEREGVKPEGADRREVPGWEERAAGLAPRTGTLIVACGNTKGALGWQSRLSGWQPVRLGAVLP